MQFSEHIVVFQGKDNSTPGSSRNLEKYINQLPNKHADLQVSLDPETWTLPTGAALQAKRAKDTVKDPIEWETQKGTEMEGIIIPKSEQVETFRDKLGSANSK